MFSKLLSLTRSWVKEVITTDTKISCYHCGEKSNSSQTVYILFAGVPRPVCCFGCAAILKAVEELGMHDEYNASKIKIPEDHE